MKNHKWSNGFILKHVFLFSQVTNGSQESSDSGVDAGDIETLYKVILLWIFVDL